MTASQQQVGSFVTPLPALRREVSIVRIRVGSNNNNVIIIIIIIIIIRAAASRHEWDISSSL